jgi:DNA-binding LacI/PurR family transcriptional regulator
MKQLLASETSPDGVFCFNDPMVPGVIDCILRAGLRVPQDIVSSGATTSTTITCCRCR